MTVGMNISNSALTMIDYERTIVECVSMAALSYNIPAQKDWEGTHVEWRVNTKPVSSVAFGVEGGQFPLANTFENIPGLIGRKHLYASIQMTNSAPKAARGGANSFRSAADMLVKGMTDTVIKLKNVMFFLDGTGILASLSGTVTSGTTDIQLVGIDTNRPDDTNPIAGIWPGATYDVLDASASYAVLGTVKVAAVVPLSTPGNTVTVTLESPGLPAGCSTGDVLCWHNSYGLAYEGLSNLIDNDTSVNFQGIDYSTYPAAVAQSSVVLAASNTPRALSPTLFRQLQQLIRERGKPANGLKFLTHPAQATAFASMFEADHYRYTSSDSSVGNDSLTLNTPFGACTLELDPDCQPSNIFALDPSELRFYTQAPLAWLAPVMGQGGQFAQNQNSANLTARMMEIGQYAIFDRRKSGKIMDLSGGIGGMN